VDTDQLNSQSDKGNEQELGNTPIWRRATLVAVGILLYAAALALGEILVNGRQNPTAGATLLAFTAVVVFLVNPQWIRQVARKDVPQLLRTWWRWLRGHVYAGVIAAAVVVVPVAVFGIPALFPHTGTSPGCPEPTQIRVLTAQDQLAATQQLAQAYTQATAARDPDHCPAVDMYVYAAAPAIHDTDATGALAHQWSDDGTSVPSRDVGPRPDMWLAESSSDVALVEDLARRSGQPNPIRVVDSVAVSPVVVGVFSAVPRALDRTAGQGRPVTWASVLDGADAIGGIVRADPTASTDAAVSTLAMYLGQGWRPGDTSSSPAFLSLRQTEQRVLEGLDAVGSSQARTTGDLVCRLAHAGRGHALVATEQALLQFGACEQPSTPPALVYPTDTVVLDHPFVRFTWTSPAAARAVQEFHDWLGNPDGRNALLNVGLRPPGPVDVRSMPPDRLGPPPELVPHVAPPVPQAACGTGGASGTAARDAAAGLLADLDCVRATFSTLQTPGRVLLAVDTSGSMGEATGQAGGTRSAVVADAVRASLGLMGPQDEFGLWQFPSGRRGRELVRLGRGDQAQRARLVRALSALRPGGDTPLYETVLAAARSPRSAGGRPPDLVVLTDGQDTSHGVTVGQVTRALARARMRLFVVAVGDVGCDGTPLGEIANGGCVHPDLGQLNSALRDLFGVLLKGE
jgi:hypothetical protein